MLQVNEKIVGAISINLFEKRSILLLTGQMGRKKFLLEGKTIEHVTSQQMNSKR